MKTLTAFLLTRQWRDQPAGLELVFWGASESGAVRVVFTGESAVCFISRDAEVSPSEIDATDRRALELRSLDGVSVDGLYFRHQRDLQRARDTARSRRIRLFESDINPADRFLMERFVTAGFEVRGEPLQRDGYLELVNPAIRRAEYRPSLTHLAIDIETDGLEGPLYSIAGSGSAGERVFMVGDAPHDHADDGLVYCPDERGVIEAFYAWLEAANPDLLLGWNVINFDLQYIEQRSRALGLPFAISRAREGATILPPRGSGGLRVARIPGRPVLDGIESLRAAFWTFESYELENVAQSLLGRGKHIQPSGSNVDEIRRLFREDKPRLAAYNLEDCRLVVEIFEVTNLVGFALERAQLTGLALDRHGGSVAAFDNLYLPRLHRCGRVAPDVGDVPAGPGSPGGFVMDSRPGLYDNVLVLDFKSLYPSIIRTFRIDPLGLATPGDDAIPGFAGGAFARKGAILPALIEELWQARDQAKQRSDQALSQAVKIIMNSFYGVLGSTGCRFYDARLASSITRRGHEILQHSREFIEARGYSVIYGDTDSVFVLLGPEHDASSSRDVGRSLAADLNTWWGERISREHRLESFLEIEFETHFERFLMPTVRGAQTGSKKRYAGLVRGDGEAIEIVFKGLESVRTDWTPLARRFQRELYRRIFVKEPFEAYIRTTLADLYAGKLDEELVYRKRIRRALDAYTVNVPPHVQAARKLARPGKTVRYVITRAGAEPVVDQVPAPDYDHYRERQLAPAANGILHFLGTSFEAITNAQLEIF